jgi:hypothetical protein
MTTVIDLLHDRGAAAIEHPGGTLLSHLIRVHDRLGELGLAEHVQLAGLAHAVYGTDGFDTSLLALTEREVLREIAGDETERLVYRYGGCDRERTWRNLARTSEVWSRFDDRAERLDDAELRDLVDLSIVNELDVMAHSPALAARYGDYFRSLFRSWEGLASASVTIAARAATA